MLISAPTGEHAGVLDLQKGGDVDVLSTDLDPRSEWWLIRMQVSPASDVVVGFARGEDLQVLPGAWGEQPPASALYTWGRNHHSQRAVSKVIFVYKMMNSVFKMMDFVLQMMKFVFKSTSISRQSRRTLHGR